MNQNNPEQLPHILKQGMMAAWPICLGYVPIGLALGVLAQKSGLQPLEIGLMSVIVFAGSSQFIAVSMLSAGAAPLAVIMTTFMVNLRHLLMSSSLSVFLTGANRLKLSFFAYGVTDESFVINHTRFSGANWDLDRAIVLNQTANFTWILSTVVGALGGQFIPAHAFGIDYALVAMFISLLVIQLRAPVFWLTAIVSGSLATILALMIPGNSYIVIASVIAASIGALVKREQTAPGSKKDAE